MANYANSRQAMKLHLINTNLDGSGKTTYLCLAHGLIEPLIKTETSRKYGFGVFVSFGLDSIKPPSVIGTGTLDSLVNSVWAPVTVSYGLLYGVEPVTIQNIEKLRAEQLMISTSELPIEKYRNTFKICGVNSINIHKAAQGARMLSAISHVLPKPDVTDVALARFENTLRNAGRKNLGQLSSEMDYFYALCAFEVVNKTEVITYIFNGTPLLSVDNKPIAASGIVDFKLETSR
ncbi:MAG: hypothetical protein Q7T16_03655 [Candidatus Burarchaeum sp.]|nr:hypothetical protein [Candidatus Burarchaeum sp.]MDO8339727.1 hypothetical protein [Candidatus Burarchaeum sp.]